MSRRVIRTDKERVVERDAHRPPSAAGLWNLYTSRMFRRGILIAFLVSAVIAPSAAAKPAGILYALDTAHVTVHDMKHLSLPAAAGVTWFTDRPNRSAGMTTLRDLQRSWRASGFAKSPPNAALVLSERGQTRMHVVELSNPRILGRRVVFRIRRLPGAVAAGRADRDPIVPGDYARAAVFIDDAAVPPCPDTLLVTGTGSCLFMEESPLQILVRAPTGIAHVTMCSSVAGGGGVVTFNGVLLQTSPCGQFSDATFVFGPPQGMSSASFLYLALDDDSPITVQYSLKFPAWAAQAGT